MKTYLFIFIMGCFLLFSGCSPQRRLARLVERHPELRVADTVVVADTLVIAGVKADTAVPVSRLTDTVVMERERLVVKVVKVRDTLFIAGECKSDTVIREIRIPIEKIKVVQLGRGWKTVLWWSLIGVAGLVVLRKIMR